MDNLPNQIAKSIIIGRMKNLLRLPNCLLICLLPVVLVACGGNTDDPPPVPDLPTRFDPSPTPAQVSESGGVSDNPEQDRVVIEASPVSATPTASATLTPTTTLTSTITVTPSMTITDTPSPSVTATFTITMTPTETLEPNPLNFLAQMGLDATVLPQSFIATSPAQAAPVAPNGTPAASSTCQFTPPGGFGVLVSTNPALTAQIGCPVGAPPETTSRNGALQGYERGSMIWIGDPVGSIYVLYADGTFARYDDTFSPGVDPEMGGETPPEGLVEPIRGFGKIWREQAGVREGIGWATGGESGDVATTLDFTNGRMIYLPGRGDILVLAYTGGNPASGTWQAIPGQF